VTHRWPQWLPGGNAILYTANTHTGSYDDATLVIESVPDGPRKRVYQGGYYGRYLPGGHLLFAHEGTLFGAAFDLATRQVTGAAIPVIEDLRVSTTVGAAQLTFSEDGTFVYAMGGADAFVAPIQWLSRDGTLTPLRTEPANWAYLRFSPAGDRLAMRINDRVPDVWV
jgi:serine/threonine-protein kinase